MDKWKDIELEKMKAGGNQNAREFFEDQDDYDDTMNIQQKYNSKAAALYRDKVATLAGGKTWNAATSAAQKHVRPTIPAHTSSMSGGSFQQQQHSGGMGGYQDGASTAGYQNLVNSNEFKDQKQQYFNRVQEQNASRPE